MNEPTKPMQSKLKARGRCVVCLSRLGFGCVIISRITHLGAATVRRHLNPQYANKCKMLAAEWQKRNRALLNAKIRNNPEKQRIRVRKWRNKNRHKAALYERKALLIPQRKIASNLRRRVRELVHGSKSAKTFALVGCTPIELKQKLESAFVLGMNWNNYGKEWHIDHKKPVSLFDLVNPEHQREAFHFSNLQPLWAADNIRKHNKYDKQT